MQNDQPKPRRVPPRNRSIDGVINLSSSRPDQTVEQTTTRPQPQLPLQPSLSQSPKATYSGEGDSPTPPIHKEATPQRQSVWSRFTLFVQRHKKWLLIGLIALISLLIVTVGLLIWHQKTQAPADLSATKEKQLTPKQRQAAEGSDKSKDNNRLKNYVVAADLPRAIYIDSIHVAARVMPMGVNPDNSMQAPINIYDAGWYTGSAKPGAKGAVVIDGHASGSSHEGLFAYLDTLKNGDTMQIEKGDNTRLTYKVVHTETVPLDKVDMNKVMQPYGSATEGMNLITCTGKWTKNNTTMDHRVLVYTERVS